MAWLVVALLLFVIIVFGYTSGAQSYATAQQAQAQIEVAQVAQVNAWGNLVTILTVAFLILVVVLLLAAVLWMALKISLAKQQQPANERARAVTTTQAPMLDSSQLGLLVQMRILEMLESWRSHEQLPAQRDETGEPFSWLR